VGTPVEILYEPVLVAATPDGRVFVESHRDVYRHAGDPEPRLRALLKTGGLAERVEWDAARGVLRAREGVAREIPRR
jgi:L,D-transpeptidase ErfK/SrfK